MRPLLLPLPLLFLLAPALAQTAPDAAAITERDRGLNRALGLILAGEPGRSILLLIDPTGSLKQAEFAGHLETVLLQKAERLKSTRIGVAAVGEKGGLAPTLDRAALLRGVREIVAVPREGVVNVYAAVRRRAKSSLSDLVLVTLENGDGEQQLEATLAALRRAKVRLQVIAREAFLSDSYWARRPTSAPRGLEMAGADGAFVELAWGWRFQAVPANEVVPSGFAVYGLSRLASGSGGRVFLHYPASSGHSCTVSGGGATADLFCNLDHSPANRGYRAVPLRAIAPGVGSRARSYAAAGRDPWFRAALRAWSRAAKEGLLASRPSVARAGSGLKPQRNQLARVMALGGSLGFAREAAKAERMAAACDRIATDLKNAIARAKGGRRRYQAIAEFTHLMLRLTRLNLLGFAAFAREVAPVTLGKRETRPPELSLWRKDFRYTGIGFSSMSLCHGVTPFAQLHLPGGPPIRAEIARFDRLFRSFTTRYAHTPFALAAYRSGIARYSLAGIGKNTPPPQRTPRSSGSPDTTTRPSRGGPSSKGSTTTSGGG